MPINVSDAINSDTAEPIVIKKFPAGAYVDGIWTLSGDAPTTRKALASVQQPTPQQLKILPEGMRSSDKRLFICNKPVKTVSQEDETVADHIIWNGNEYKCYSVADWAQYGHNTVIGVKQ